MPTKFTFSTSPPPLVRVEGVVTVPRPIRERVGEYPRVLNPERRPQAVTWK